MLIGADKLQKPFTFLPEYLSLSLSLQIRALHNNEKLPNLLFEINLKKAKILYNVTI